jgi:hypothetical protein
VKSRIQLSFELLEELQANVSAQLDGKVDILTHLIVSRAVVQTRRGGDSEFHPLVITFVFSLVSHHLTDDIKFWHGGTNDKLIGVHNMGNGGQKFIVSKGE